MKVLGIVAEYNPFHNGHLFHIEESKKICNADCTVAVMSGNFTQRGEPAIVDKWTRTHQALSNGIDLVIELPTLYSISSAENFAEGAIKILSSLGIIDYLSFGSETSNLDYLFKIANILYTEPTQYKDLLHSELNKGLSFPKARSNALISYLNDANITNIINSPNNILGIEYIKSLYKLNSDIKPICIQRKEVGYNQLSTSDTFASASAIRNLILKNSSCIDRYLPASSYTLLKRIINNGTFINDLSEFDSIITYKIRTMSKEELKNIPEISEGLENKLKEGATQYNTVYEILDFVKSKRYTLNRLKRILLYILLNITKEDMVIAKSITPYIRVLGFTSNGKKILSKISEKNPNVITSPKRFIDSNDNKDLNILLQKDIEASNIYTIKYNEKPFSNLDFTQKLITL